MKEDNILVIDTGSSSMRGIVINREGRILLQKQLSNFMTVSQEGIAEQDATSFQKCLIRICSDINKECSGKGFPLAAICFTSQRSSVLPVDRDGQPLSKACMWYDKRSLDICNKMNEVCQRKIYSICGMKPTPVLSAPKMLWIKENRKELYRSSHKLIGIHDYLLYLCTGHFVTDLSLASRTCLLNIKTRGWSEELLDLFGLDADKLCELILPGEKAGCLTASFSEQTGLPQGLPVISSGGDQQCSLLGQAITQMGEIGITSGTGAYVAALTDTPSLDTQMRLNTTLSVLPDRYVLEANTMTAGSVYHWLQDTFYPKDSSYQIINAQILQSPPGAGGLIMLPDLAGKGCPQWDGSVKGSFHNIGFHNNRGDFARAALEGICAEIKECRDVISELTFLTGTITSAGGLSRFSAYNQILADMLDSPVAVCSVDETTALGAWAVAAVSLEIYKNTSDALLVQRENYTSSLTKQLFLPDADCTELYKKQEAARIMLRAASIPI